MPIHDDLGTRMKTFYEEIPKTRLMRRMPAVIRLDGRAFHTFTRGFAKPFDQVLMTAMQKTTKYLCENIQGCVFGYTQSDEITLILVDYQKFTTAAWYDYEVQKVCSVSASMATMAFNRFFKAEVDKWGRSIFPGWDEGGYNDLNGVDQKDIDLLNAYSLALSRGAMFDSRFFSIPKEEVTNLIYWRQLDATRNSIQMVGQANFSHAELQNKTCNMIQDMLHEQRGINWNDFPVPCKRGTSVIRSGKDEYSEWIIDENMPILKGEDRAYVDNLIYIGEGM